MALCFVQLNDVEIGLFINKSRRGLQIMGDSGGIPLSLPQCDRFYYSSFMLIFVPWVYWYKTTDRQTPDKVIPLCRYASQVTQKCLMIWRIIYLWWAKWTVNEPFHAKTYNLNWRHNLVKRRHNFAGNLSKVVVCPWCMYTSTACNLLVIIPSQQSWRGYSNAAVRGWLGEWVGGWVSAFVGGCVVPSRFTLWTR